MESTRFETGISENNLRHWGELECLKEFLQNVVYADTILGDEAMIEYHDGEAIISNSPSGFDKGKLLIGESNQAGVVGAPGEYGEGQKVAMAVACRLGYHITIQTNGFKVEPKLEPSSLDSQVKVLVFYITDTPGWQKGTVVRIQCHEEILDRAKGYFAILNGVPKEDTIKDTILKSRPGIIYVNGVKITQVHSIFGYNFTNAILMNRDRTSIDSNELKNCISMVMSNLINTKEDAKTVLAGILKDDSVIEANSQPLGWAVSSVWKDAMKEMYGDKVVIATGKACDEQARYLRFKILPRVPSRWSYFFRQILGVDYSDDMLAHMDNIPRMSVKPKGDSSLNLGWAKRLVKLYVGDYGTVKVSKNLVDSFGNTCSGLYDTRTGVIWLDEIILGSKRNTFGTLLHETLHKLTGAEDNTEKFTKAWEMASWKILMRGKE